MVVTSRCVGTINQTQTNCLLCQPRKLLPTLQTHLPSPLTDVSLSNICQAKRDLLEKYLRGELQQPMSARSIARRPPDSPLQLSFAQERLWFLDQLNPNSAVFNVPLTVKLSDTIDSEALRKSVNEIVRRHEVLRTTFRIRDGHPEVVVAPELNLELPVIDLSVYPASQREAQVHVFLSEEEQRPFDLTHGPLIRTKLFRLSNRDHRFIVNMHHIVSDGWSLVLFFEELSAIYEAFARGQQSPLREVPIQYFDYSAWQREWLQGEVLHKQVAYWKNQLGNEIPVLDLPTDRPRPSVQTFNGAREWLVLPEDLTASILALAQREGVTQFITLLTAFKVLLHRYTGQEDIIVGSPIANRPQTETETLIGFFLNNLALRSDFSSNPTFREALARVRKTALDAYAHQDVPFEKLIESLKPERDLSRTPIFQVYFNLFNFADEIKLPGTDETVTFVQAWEQSDEKLSKFDLTLYAGLQDQRLKLALVYNTDLFDASSIQLMLEHFRHLLTAAVADPEKSIADLSLQPGAEGSLDTLRSSQIHPTNTFTEFTKAEIEQSIATRLASQVKKYPTRLAVKSENHSWTYRDLDVAVNQVAQSILRLNGGTEERVALLFEHDAPMVAGMLGALRAGKTYVPLDPHHPKERLVQIIEHAECAAVLTNNKNRAMADELVRMTDGRVKLIHIDHLRSVTSETELEIPAVEPGRLAYILYTSGSTGEPKGVMQSHRNVLHYIRVYTNNLHLNAEDRLTLLSSYCFDASVMDIYGALLNGATLYPIDIREQGLAGLSERLISDEITVYHSTPTVYRYFLGAQASLPAVGAQASLPADVGNRNLAFPKVRLVVLGGEKVNRTDVELYQQHFSDQCLFVNGLGPTEATVSLQNFINKKTRLSGESVPVGFAVDDTEVLLLDKAGRVSAVSGEIAIRSAHVALGYWRNTEATTKAFSTNGHGPSIRLYRTGDMGRRLPDGSIKFEGRKDFQIKIRGFRVELDEIESVLAQHERVREAVVIAHENGNGDKKLTAYVVPLVPIIPRQEQSGSGNSTAPSASIVAELRDFLKLKLPEYMVPSLFVMLESLPLTPSGKLNRRALGAQASGVPIGAAPMGCSSLPADSPQDSQHRQSEHRGLPAYVAPHTPLEKMLAPIWSELLEVNAVGINDNFFELGGHSLLAVRLFAQIEKSLGKRLPLATLFQAPTVAKLAMVIEDGLHKDRAEIWSSLVEIQPGHSRQSTGSKPAFFCVHALGGNVLEYYDLARHLGEDQPFYGLQSQGLDGRRPPHTRVEDMAAHYIKEMRELQPEGPYFIGGRSLGGMVAFEMAQQLKALGQTVGLLALLDTYPSGYAKLFRNEKTLRAALRRGLRRTKAHLANLQSLTVNEGLDYLINKARFAPRKVKSQVWRRLHRSYENVGRPLPRMLKDVKEFNSLAVRDYVPQVYDGSVTLFWASEDLRTSIDLVEGWRVLAGGGIEVHEIPGNHLDIVKEPHVHELAKKLRECLLQARPNN
jgi:amino acid adenylation domain-containing protein